MKSTSKKDEISSVASSFKCFKYVWQREANGKIYTVLRCFNSLLNIVLPLVFAVFPGFLINELTSDADINKVIIYTAVIIGSPVIVFALNKLTEYKITDVLSKFNNNSNKVIYGRITETDYEQFENPEVHNLELRAVKSMEQMPQVVDIYCRLFAAVVQFALIFTLVFTLGLWMVLIVAAVSVLNYFASKWLSEKSRENDLRADLLDCKLCVYTYVLSEPSFFMETKIFNSREFMISHLMESQRNLDESNLKYQRQNIAVDGVSTLGRFAQQAALYGYLIFSVLKGLMTVGTMTIYISSVEQFGNSIRSITDAFLAFKNMRYSLNDIVDFFSIPQKQLGNGTEHPQLNDGFEIEFKNVSFKYPGSEKYAIRNLNLTVKSDERLCIVGENGSGKTTFVKLLTRLYSPDEGEILLNGKNIYDYDYYEYIDMFAPVFQDCNSYDFDFATNICLSDSCEAERLKKAIDEAGLSGLVKSLPKREHTMIGKSIDETGIEPSGGELQRIAIARALYKGGDIYILDEPTAALDPNAEYEIYTRFHRMIEGKTAVLITHRLSAVQLADKVAVFADGHVEEYGTHAELYARGGMYREMFDKQSEFYVKANENQ